MIRRDFRCPGPSFDKLRMSGSDAVRVDVRQALRWNGSLHPLLAEIEAYQRDRRLGDSAFGLRATGDPGLVTQMRQGRWPRAATVARVRAWILRQAQDERDVAQGGQA